MATKRSKRAEKSLPATLEPTKSALRVQVEASLDLLERSVGGRGRLIDALIVSSHPSAKKFIAALEKEGNGERSLFEICEKVRTSPDEIIKIFTEGSMVRSTVEAMMKLSDGLPGIVDIALESARIKGPAGFQDRQMLMKAGGMLQPEGTVSINNVMNQMNLGSEGSFEKIVGSSRLSLSQNPFDIEVEGKNG